MSDYVATSLGRIGYGLPQPYAPASAYRKRDVVQYQGGCFVVLKDGLEGVAPADDGVNYRLLCERGQAGEGNAVWFAGAAVTGRGAGIVAGVPGSKAGDMYLNSLTSDLYNATAADTWDWSMNLGEAVQVTASAIATEAEGVSVQEALNGLAARAAADIATEAEGVSVQEALDGVAARTAADIPTEAEGVSVQEALNAKLPRASVVNNLATTASGYALDARQGKYLLGLIEAIPERRKLLWSGSWSSGSIPLSEAGKYSLYLFAAGSILYVGYRIADNLQCFSLTTDNGHVTNRIAVYFDGTNAQMTVNQYLTHTPSGSHGAFSATPRTVTEIYGII